MTPRPSPYGPRRAVVLAPLTRAVIWVNLAIFALEVIKSRSIEGLMGPPDDVLAAFGANSFELTVRLGQYQRLVAACFLHGSILHVALNMSALWQIGPFVERAVGMARYAVLYVVTGIAASATSVGWGMLRGGGGGSVGASGAICGVMGAAVIVGLRVEGWRSPIARQIGFWLAVTVGLGATVPHIDNAAHVGGLAVGALIAAVWRRGVVYSRAATIAAVGISALVCLAAGAVQVIEALTEPFATITLRERMQLVQNALDEGDCRKAREAMAAAEAVAPGAPAIVGLGKRVDSACPRGTK